MQNIITNSPITQNYPSQQEDGYIAVKNQNNFFDIKTKLKEIIENIISPQELSFDEQINEYTYSYYFVH